VGGFELDGDEDVEAGDAGVLHRHEATVAIMNKEVCAEGFGGVVIDAASAVGWVAQHEGGLRTTESDADVGEGVAVHEKTLR
jgi:hypothetical protein